MNAATPATERRVLSFRIGPSHSDFLAARDQCVEARRLRNTIVAVSREANAYRMWSDDTKHQANTSVSDAVGRVCGKFARSEPYLGADHVFVAISKEIADAQNIHLPAKVVQRVRILAAKSWKAFLNNPSRHGRAPGYTKTYATTEFTVQAISKKKLAADRAVVPSGWSTGVTLPDHVDPSQVTAARVVPLSRVDFRLEVIYSIPAVPEVTLERFPVENRRILPDGALVAGIDLGVNNLATVAFSDHREGIIVNGRPLKSINSFYNKLIANRRGLIDEETENRSRNLNGKLTPEDERYTPVPRKPSVTVDTWWIRRNRKINHYLHTASSQLTAELVAAGVDVVVIGWSPGFKHRLSLGKKGNQRFALIPHRRFIDELQRKLAENGIAVIEREESYTSQASFLDGDPIPTYDPKFTGKHSFSGKRVKRGLYVTADGCRINADLNGGYNVAAKEFQGIVPPAGEHDKGTVVVPARRLKPKGHVSRRTELVAV